MINVATAISIRSPERKRVKRSAALGLARSFRRSSLIARSEWLRPRAPFDPLRQWAKLPFPRGSRFAALDRQAAVLGSWNLDEQIEPGRIERKNRSCLRLPPIR